MVLDTAASPDPINDRTDTDGPKLIDIRRGRLGQESDFPMLNRRRPTLDRVRQPYSACLELLALILSLGGGNKGQRQ